VYRQLATPGAAERQDAFWGLTPLHHAAYFGGDAAATSG
jgi:hypothetical protein